MVVVLFMGTNYFTDEQLRLLEENPYVVKASKKSITYSEEFKELYWIDYQNEMQPIEIFKKYGFDPYALGARRRDNFTDCLKKQAAREDGFKDTRSKNSGRPSTKELSLEESDLYEILAGRLHSAISDPFIRRLFSTLKLDDEIQQLEFELTTSVDEYSDEEFVIELFSKGMAIKWLEPKVKSLENTVKFFGGKEEKKLKDDFSLNKALLKEMKIEQQKLIRDYGFAFKPYSSTES